MSRICRSVVGFSVAIASRNHGIAFLRATRSSSDSVVDDDDAEGAGVMRVLAARSSSASDVMRDFFFGGS